MKFYRPGRWSRDALRDEQDFLFELSEREIPVIAPMKCADGQFLQEHHGMYYAVFPKKGGRACDEPTPRLWLELGLLLARVHAVGGLHPPRDRIELGPQQSTSAQMRFILDSDFVRPSLRSQYEEAVRAVLDLISI